MKKMLKKKGFLIDKITEDSFYENLLLGLISVLKSCRFVNQIRLERYPPATLEEVGRWEYTNGIIFAEDLRNFFLSTNGFSFTYKFQYDKSEVEDPSYYVIGGIEINSLSQLEKISTTETMYLTEGGIKILAPYSKIHILTKLGDDNCVVLAQFNPSKPASIWLYYKMKNFYFLSEDFVTYFRMALAYVGVPGWQLSALKASLPEWSDEMIHILAPGVFENRTFDNKSDLNVLDSSIFDYESPPDFLSEVCSEPENKEKVNVAGSVCDKKKSAKNKKK